MTSVLPPLPLTATPRLAPGITVDDPLADAGQWIIARDGAPAVRVSEPVAVVARRFTGDRSIAEIAAALGDPWTADDVGLIARRLDGAGLLAADADTRGSRARRPRRRGRRLQYRPPLTLQWSVGDPSALFAALRPLTRAVAGAPGVVIGAAVVVAGVVATALGWSDIVSVLESPLPLSVIAWLGLAIVLTTIVHELGHGATLSAFGGSPRRIGVMLFYLAPAFFCDVTDGWRLSRRRQRVLVALAGPAVHLVCAAASIVASRFVVDDSLHAGLVLYALSCLAIAALNLLPFVQLDGYLALMSALDWPHLRRDAMTAAGHSFLGLLGGAARSTGAAGPRPESDGLHRAGRHRGLLIAYGILCRLFPVGLVGFVLYRYATSVAGLGTVPALCYLATLGLVAAVVFRALLRGAKALAASAPNPWRVAAAAVATSALIAAVLMIPVSSARTVGFVSEGGEVRLVASAGETLPEAGTPVALESSGILIQRRLGTAVVGDGKPQRGEIDLAALVPVTPSTLRTDGVQVALSDVRSGALPRFGRARVDDGDARSLGAWLWRTFLDVPLAALGSEARA
ncbi:daptide biosynthesis intramembrane metalloprotease [Microbacterium sp. NPDC012755]|uniref:daptide biosynthesis intramembrane metalloprotease n=1 Tax=Microbacterium sp. NPDC012755 TaxID=3364184 RepID=UPI0036B8AD6E